MAVAKSKLKIKQKLLPAILATLLVILTFLTFQVIFIDKFFPFSFIGDANVTLLTKPQAQKLIRAKFDSRIEKKINFEEYSLDLITSSPSLDYNSLEVAFALGHKGTIFEKLKGQFSTLIFQSRITPRVSLNLDSQIEIIAQAILQPPQNAQLIFNETTTPESSPSANIQTEEAKDGIELDKDTL